MVKLDQTDLVQNVNVRHFGGTDNINSVSRCARVRAKPHISETDHMNSLRPISVISKQRLGQANSVGPRNVTKRKQRYYNPISVRPICLWFVAVAMTSKLGGAR